MHDPSSNPDGICTADLCLERDSYELERISDGVLSESIADCCNPKMLFDALSSIDLAIANLQARKRQAENKVHALAFASELIAV